MGKAEGKIAAIGTWDGVHPGHRFVLDALVAKGAELGLEPVAVTFRSHPLSVVAPERAPRYLSSLADRVAMLREAGAADVITLDFDNSLRAMTAARFLSMLHDRYNVKAVMLGFNNSFGSDRLKGVEAYRAVAPEGMTVIQIPEYEGDSGRVSSSLIRKLISDGDVAGAARRLGRLYSIRGRVVGGRRLGRTIGFPTANLAVDSGRLLPSAGVYAADAVLSNGLRFRAVVNIGYRPTVDRSVRPRMTVEAHLLGFSGDLYSSTVILYFLDRIRREERFPSVEALKAAISRDAAMARNIVSPLDTIGCR